MQTTKKIQKAISGFEPGQVFTYEQLQLQPVEYRAAVKALGRMTSEGIIKRASTGRYYKPKSTVFGDLKPGEDELLKPYLFDKGKRVAYITGASLYNKMGLTTQVSRNIKVASRDKRIITKIGSIKVKPVKSYVDVTDDNYKLLEILDAIKDFKAIPDLDKMQVIKRLNQEIKKLKPAKLQQLVKLSLNYPPRVRAFTGALLSGLQYAPALTKPLAGSLNPLSTYQFGISDKELPERNQWKVN
jgi:hypothetical protein